MNIAQRAKTYSADPLVQAAFVYATDNSALGDICSWCDGEGEELWEAACLCPACGRPAFLICCEFRHSLGDTHRFEFELNVRCGYCPDQTITRGEIVRDNSGEIFSRWWRE